MIDDPELRLMFTAECEERLQRLEQDLLQLEKQPDLQSCLEEIAREIHSIKGAARMLNVIDMEQFAHHFESLLRAGTENGKTISLDVIERLYAAVDILRRLGNAAVNETHSGIDLEQAILTLNTETKTTPPPVAAEAVVTPVAAETKADSPPITESVAKPVIEPVIEPVVETKTSPSVEKTIPVAAVEDPSEKKQMETESKPAETLATASTTNDQYKIETIRVATQKLDNLMTHAGELAVSKNRIEQRLTDVDQIVFLWEQAKSQKVDSSQRNKYCGELERNLTLLRNHIYEDNARFAYLSNEIEAGVRSTRLLPLSTVFNLFPRMVRDIAKQEQKQVVFTIHGEETVADKRVIEEIKDPLTHLIRNSIHHALESVPQREKLNKSPQGNICLRAYQTASNIVIEVEDDGRGIDCEKIKHYAVQRKLHRQDELDAMNETQIQSLIFEHGFSTAEYITDISGRGVGMPIVKSNIEALKGRIEIESKLNKGTLIRLRLPMTVTTTQVLIVQVQKRFYGLPLESIEFIRQVNREQIFSIDGCDTLIHQEKAISVAHLAGLLGMEDNSVRQEWMCVIIAVDQQRLAILVDDLVNEQEVMLKPIGGLLKNTPNISGASILGDGSVCIILNHNDLIKNSHKKSSAITQKSLETEKKSAGLILYAEDSVTTRTQVKRILEKEGFEVVAAVDGLDAYSKLANYQFDGVVSDVEMPNMSGLMLTEKIRADSRYQNVPIVLVSAKDKPEDKRKGLEVGATAYISKGSFNQTVLIETLKRLV